MIYLEKIHTIHRHEKILYQLLKERSPKQAISHKKMPSTQEHIAFINTNPYEAWYFIVNYDGYVVGSIYLSKQREIGLAIFNEYQRKGYGKIAVELLREKHAGKMLANINPDNEASIKFFTGLGFKLLQQTYEL